MTTSWQKVRRDFAREGGRTVLVVLAISMGISGFSAVLASYAILTRALNVGYRATNPASATIRFDRVDADLLAAVRADREVSDAEARRTLRGRIRGPAGWRNLELFVVDDFRKIRVSTLVPEKGAWPPAAGEVLIERDAFQVAKIHIGDMVTARTDRGPDAVLRVSGSVHDVGQAQARMENVVYGYATLETIGRLGEEPLLDELKILVADRRLDEDHIRRVAAGVQKIAESRGRVVRQVDIPVPGKHPHAQIMGLLLLAMAGFGLFALLLSGILVVNLMAATMAAQIRQIGVMKAIGGTRGQIAGIYLRQALLLGASAVAVATPVGIAGSRILCRAMAVFLNFDIPSFAIPAWVFLLVASVGVAVPLLAAAGPVMRASGMSVRKALDDFGVSATEFGTSAFDRAVAGIGGIARPMLLAIRNGFRRRARLAMTVATLAVGGVFFMTALNVRASMIHTLDRMFAAKKFDLTVKLATLSPGEAIDRAITKTPGVVRGEGWIVIEGAFAEAGTPEAKPAPGGPHSGSGGHGGGMHGREPLPAGQFTVVALPPKTGYVSWDLLEGRSIHPGETDAIVVNNALAAKDPKIRVGATVALRLGPETAPWRVVGIVREPFSPAVGYISKEKFDEFHPGMANSLRIVLAKTDPALTDRVRAALDRNLEAEGVRVLASGSKAESRVGFDQHMVMIYVFLIIVSCVLGGVGGLGLMTTMSLNVLERRRELGVLRAIGATPAAVAAILVGEGAAIGLASWAVAAMGAWPFGKAAGNLLVRLMFQTGLDFMFEKRGWAIWLLFSLSVGALASFVPAWRASRRPVSEALGYE